MNWVAEARYVSPFHGALDDCFFQAEVEFGEPQLLSLSLEMVYQGASKAAFASQGCFAWLEQKGVAALNCSGNTWYWWFYSSKCSSRGKGTVLYRNKGVKKRKIEKKTLSCLITWTCKKKHRLAFFLPFPKNRIFCYLSWCVKCIAITTCFNFWLHTSCPGSILTFEIQVAVWKEQFFFQLYVLKDETHPIFFPHSCKCSFIVMIHSGIQLLELTIYYLWLRFLLLAKLSV